jgi:hypothetical protein
MSLHTPPSKTLASLKALGAELDDITAQHLYGPDAPENIAQWGTVTPLAAATVTGTPITAADVPRKRRPRLAIAASVAVLLVGGSVGIRTFRDSRQRLAHEIPDNPARPGGPFAVPTYIPKDFCLTGSSHSTEVGRDQYELKSTGGKVINLNVEYLKYDFESAVGTNVKVGNADGSVSTFGRMKSVRWAINHKTATAQSAGVDVATIARVGAQLNLDKPLDSNLSGFVISNAKPQGANSIQQYGICPFELQDKIFQPTLLISSDFGNASWNDYYNVEKPFELNRDDASTIQVARESQNGLYLWKEGATQFVVYGSNIDDSEVLRVIASMVPMEQKAFELQVVHSEVAGVNQKAKELPPGNLASVTVNGHKVLLKTFERNGVLALGYWEGAIVGSPSTSLSVNTPGDNPDLGTFYGSSVGQQVAVAVALPSVVKAIVTMPNGKAIELPEVHDSRKTTLHMFIWARTTSEPRPVKVEYFNKAGKIIHTQR